MSFGVVMGRGGAGRSGRAGWETVAALCQMGRMPARKAGKTTMTTTKTSSRIHRMLRERPAARRVAPFPPTCFYARQSRNVAVWSGVVLASLSRNLVPSHIKDTHVAQYLATQRSHVLKASLMFARHALERQRFSVCPIAQEGPRVSRQELASPGISHGRVEDLPQARWLSGVAWGRQRSSARLTPLRPTHSSHPPGAHTGWRSYFRNNDLHM